MTTLKISDSVRANTALVAIAIHLFARKKRNMYTRVGNGKKPLARAIL